MSRNTQGLKRGGSPGRPKGVPNKLTAALKDAILHALAEAGGTAYLVHQAHENPTAFLTLIGKVLPLQVNQDGAEPRMPAKVIHELHFDRQQPSERFGTLRSPVLSAAKVSS